MHACTHNTFCCRWSLCNEALCMGFDAETAKVLKPIVKELDPLGQRPVTAAMNGGYDSAFAQVLDVVGINYHVTEYDPYHKAHPSQPMIGSETSSDVSDRSVYANNSTAAYVSAYDVNKPGWGQTAEDAWCAIESRDFVSGGFCWTGFDYKV
jgi:beta-galactosidase